MKLLLALLFSFLVDPVIEPVLFGDEHDFHVSKSLIQYNEQEGAWQISMHLFIDDLEEALRQRGADKLFLCTPKEAAGAENHLRRYLQQNFLVEVNSQPATYTFLGKEISEDMAAVWCYLEIPDTTKPDQLTVTNKILTEVYDDQKNIVSVFGPGNQKGLLLFQKGKTRESVSF